VRRRLPGRRVLLVLPAAIVIGVSMVGLALALSAPSSPASAASSPISYRTLPASYVSAGEPLFEATCSSCHGPGAQGTSRAPNLVGLGEGTVAFWVGTGRMPLEDAASPAIRKPPRYDEHQAEEIAAFIASLSPTNGPGIPVVNLSQANLAEGNALFVLNCAACHTITGSGDALSDGAFAPSLHHAKSYQAAEAIRTGPGNMPRFGPENLTNQQVDDVIAFVIGPIQHPDNAGGLGLGGIGPVAEGFVGLLVGVGGLALIAYWIGDRS
jgi:ubiquinol-cytochrome c reductase cytochrome c subunit